MLVTLLIALFFAAQIPKPDPGAEAPPAAEAADTAQAAEAADTAQAAEAADTAQAAEAADTAQAAEAQRPSPAGSAPAHPPACADDTTLKSLLPDGVRLPDACPAIFGDDTVERRNRTRRRALLRDVTALSNGIVEVTHSATWGRPEWIGYDGLELESVEDDACVPFAVFEVETGLPGIECEPGRYAVTVDDGLGRGVRVLAIVEDVVLLDSAGTLGYAASIEHHDDVAWRMVWRSPFLMPRPRSDTASKSKARKSRRARRRKRRGRR
jgi:hypothetical protein